MKQRLVPDQRILAYGVISLILTFVFGPLGLLLGIRTRFLYIDAAIRYGRSPRDEFDPQLAKIGSSLGFVSIVIGIVGMALLPLFVLIGYLLSSLG